MEYELQLIYQYTETASCVWSILAFWTSISFGLMAASYVAAKRLHTLIVVMITILYVSFTVYVGQRGNYASELLAAIQLDLTHISDKGALVFHSSEVVRTIGFDNLYARMSTFGTFAGTLIFLWYSHLKPGKDTTS